MTFFGHKKFNLLKSQILSCFTRVPAHKNPTSYPGRFSDPAIYQSKDVQINKLGSTLTADRSPGATKNFIWATKFRILVARSSNCNFCESCRLTWLTIFVSSLSFELSKLWRFVFTCVVPNRRELKKDGNVIWNSCRKSFSKTGMFCETLKSCHKTYSKK